MGSNPCFRGVLNSTSDQVFGRVVLFWMLLEPFFLKGWGIALLALRKKDL